MDKVSMSVKRRFVSAAKRFVDDAKGVAAIEFAYLVPILMLMTFGTFEVSRALIMHKRFQRATAMVGDLVAREQQLGDNWTESQAALDGILRAAEQVMAPYSSTALSMGIYQLRADSNDPPDTTVEWSYSYNGMSVTACPSPKDMPADGMISSNNAAVLVESSYQYTPFLLNLPAAIMSAASWSDSMVFSPRDGSVDYQDSTPTGCP